MVDVHTISVVIAAASVVIGVVIGAAQLRDLKKTRQDELFMPIYARYQEKEFMKHYTDIMFNWEWKDFNDWWQKYGPETNPEALAQWASVGQYFHCIGVLLKRKRIDPALVEDLIRDTIIRFCEKIEPIIKEVRIVTNYPRGMHGAEYLYNEMKRR